MIFNRVQEDVSTAYAPPSYPPATPGGADVSAATIASSDYWEFPASTELRLVICSGQSWSLVVYHTLSHNCGIFTHCFCLRCFDAAVGWASGTASDL